MMTSKDKNILCLLVFLSAILLFVIKLRVLYDEIILIIEFNINLKYYSYKVISDVIK